jgi:hypothetical protein
MFKKYFIPRLSSINPRNGLDGLMYDATVISRREIHDEEPEGAAAVLSGRMGCHVPITGTFLLPFSLPEASDQGVSPASYCRSDLLRFLHVYDRDR